MLATTIEFFNLITSGLYKKIDSKSTESMAADHNIHEPDLPLGGLIVILGGQ